MKKQSFFLSNKFWLKKISTLGWEIHVPNYLQSLFSFKIQPWIWWAQMCIKIKTFGHRQMISMDQERKCTDELIHCFLLKISAAFKFGHWLHMCIWNDFLLNCLGKTKDSFCPPTKVAQVELLVKYKLKNIQSHNILIISADKDLT